MKKSYIFLITVLFTSIITKAQFGVNITSTNSSVCLGGSSQLTANPTGTSYTLSSVTYNMSPQMFTGVLCTGGDLDGSFPIAPNVNPSPSVLFLDDSRWDGISIPFSFTYFGNAYNTLSVSTNGWVAFGGQSTATGLNQAIPVTTAANNAIFGLLADLDFRTASGGTIEYFYTGFAPNRVFSVLFTGARFRSAAGLADVEVKLFETSNNIEIHTNISTANTTLNKTQGVENNAGTTAVAVTGRNNTTSGAAWNAGTTAYRFVPETVTYNWSSTPAGFSNTAKTVTVTPTVNTVYSVTATNSASQTANNTSTVNIDAGSYTLAGTAGGSSISHFIIVNAGGTYYRDMMNCNLISYIQPSGASPLNNSVNNIIKVDAAASKRGTPDLYLARKYDIEPVANASTATATVKLYFLQSEFNNFNLKAADSGHKLLPTGPADATGISNFILRQCHGTGTAPNNYTGSTVDFTTATAGFSLTWDATRSWWEATIPVVGFSGFYVTSAKTAPVPVKMIYFTGTQNGTYHLLDWKANCTSTQATFEIERSSDGIRFTKINGITASQSRCAQPFDYTDAKPLPGINYYRIKVIDIDGQYYYTQVVTLINKTKGFILNAINPSIIYNENAVLKINAGEKTNAVLAITDFSGRLISKKQITIQQGLNSFVLETANLASGTYQLTAYANDSTPQTIRFVKQ